MPITLNDKELEYAINFQDLIERHGISQLAKDEFQAGSISQRSFQRVLAYLRQEGWEYAETVMIADYELVQNSSLYLDPELKSLNKKPKISLDKPLNRRLRNIFTQQEIKEQKILEKSYEEILILVQQREREILDGTYRHF